MPEWGLSCNLTDKDIQRVSDLVEAGDAGSLVQLISDWIHFVARGRKRSYKELVVGIEPKKIENVQPIEEEEEKVSKMRSGVF